MAEQAAARYWEEHTRQVARHEPTGATVSDLCAAWDAHCRECYAGTSTATNAILDVRMFRELFGNAAVSELTHADMLSLKDALIRSGVSRTTINLRLWRVKNMLAWALDEALITAQVKAELTQVRNVKRGRSAAPERRPVRPVDDATIAATVARMMPNTADMVQVHRLTGMRPCELCAMRWSLIDTTRVPWVYRVPSEANKNHWRGELGQPRVVCIGPKAREILERHRGDGDVPFSPARSMAEHIASVAAGAAHPLTDEQKAMRRVAHVPRVLGERWTTGAYTKTIAAACRRAGIKPWGANRLRHAFGTEVRRAFGLDAARAVLGHTGGGCVTDVYTFDAVADEMVRQAAPAVEALG
ncbi:MAG: tyrosine-type recombinase/integrase [Kiritimatiellia bacterium]